MVKFKKVYGIIGVFCIGSILLMHPKVFGGRHKINFKIKKPIAPSEPSGSVVKTCKWVKNQVTSAFDPETPKQVLQQVRNAILKYNQKAKIKDEAIKKFDKQLVHNMRKVSGGSLSFNNSRDKLIKHLDRFTNHLSDLKSIATADQKKISKLLETRMELCYKSDKEVTGRKIELVKYYREKAEELDKYNKLLKAQFSNYFGADGKRGQFIGGDDAAEPAQTLTASQQLQLYNLIEKNEIKAMKLKEKTIKLYQEVCTMTEIEKQDIAAQQDKRAFIDMIDQELAVRAPH
ncbi:MAG: hypothetical protein K2X94_01780 [Amoebophilaceae bacterium]|nr:hypothetical protein [Amoebophilaceae bacterium]